MINSRWGDDLRRLRDESGSPAKISKQLQAFDGIGPVGASIFLRGAGGLVVRAPLRGQARDQGRHHRRAAR